MVTPFGVTIVSSGREPSTLPPSSLAAMSTITDPGASRPRVARSPCSGGAPARHLRGGDHDVVPRDVLGQLGLLRGLLLGGELPGVTALAGLRIRRTSAR